MSEESNSWLNTYTLIGFTEKRGRAWHYQAAMQGNEPNHYPGPIPLEDVQRRLFSWTAKSAPLYTGIPGGILSEIPDRQAIVRSDNGDVLGIFKSGYQPHQYQEWFLENVGKILDDDLGIGSAGLLRNGAQAWVQVEMPDSIETSQGVTYRPNLLAVTSFDGSLATTYKGTIGIVVCDNTMGAALGETGKRFKLKHTRYSTLRIGEARKALDIVFTMAKDFEAQLDELCSIQVSPGAFQKTLDILIPLTGPDGKPLTGRSRTMAGTKRDEITRLYRFDTAVAPWAGNAFGVLQAFNTHRHHLGIVRGTSRVQRNRAAAIDGTGQREDERVLVAVRQAVSAAA